MAIWTRWMAPLVMTAVVPGGGALGQLPGETPPKDTGATVPAVPGSTTAALPPGAPGPPPAGPIRPVYHNPPAPTPYKPVPLRGKAAMGGIAGLEITRADIPARATRNLEQMSAVMLLLRGATWNDAGSLPRSRPDFWIRLVPKSGEGGDTVLIHGPIGYVSSAAGGVFTLDADTTLRLREAVWPVRDPMAAPVLPSAITQNLSGVTIRVANRAVKAPAVILAGDMIRLEPSAVDAQGNPLEVHFTLDNAELSAAIAALGSCGVLARAPKFHSPAVVAPTAPAPEKSTEGPTPSIEPGHEGMSLTVREGDWHRSWHEALGPSVFQHCLLVLERTPELAKSKAQAALSALRSQR